MEELDIDGFFKRKSQTNSGGYKSQSGCLCLVCCEHKPNKFEKKLVEIEEDSSGSVTEEEEDQFYSPNPTITQTEDTSPKLSSYYTNETSH